ncbi:hypothetical protein [Nostoc sp. UHCC 0870]
MDRKVQAVERFLCRNNPGKKLASTFLLSKPIPSKKNTFHWRLNPL